MSMPSFLSIMFSLKTASPITTLVDLGKPNTCLMSSSSKWIIDFGATNHMTGSSNLFTTFQSLPSTSTITLENGSISYVFGSYTINPTPLIPLTYVLSLPKFSKNLIVVSKLTYKLNCSISFFSNYCLFQDLLIKWIIDKGQASGGLYILNRRYQNLLHFLE